MPYLHAAAYVCVSENARPISWTPRTTLEDTRKQTKQKQKKTTTTTTTTTTTRTKQINNNKTRFSRDITTEVLVKWFFFLNFGTRRPIDCELTYMQCAAVIAHCSFNREAPQPWKFESVRNDPIHGHSPSSAFCPFTILILWDACSTWEPHIPVFRKSKNKTKTKTKNLDFKWGSLYGSSFSSAAWPPTKMGLYWTSK